MTESWLDSEVLGLSDAQLKFKMTPESWSVEEVVMHLAIAEPQYWDQFKQSLVKPVQPDFKPQATDAAMLWYGIDRTQRTTTGEARVPRGQFKDMPSARASFKKLRAEMMKTAKESQDDLRGRRLLHSSNSDRAHVHHQAAHRRLPDRDRSESRLGTVPPRQRQGRLEENGSRVDDTSRTLRRALHSAVHRLVAGDD
jgi:hypothetical protein